MTKIPSKEWWRGPRDVASKWSEECSDLVTREKMKEVEKVLDELLDLIPDKDLSDNIEESIQNQGG